MLKELKPLIGSQIVLKRDVINFRTEFYEQLKNINLQMTMFL